MNVDAYYKDVSFGCRLLFLLPGSTHFMKYNWVISTVPYITLFLSPFSLLSFELPLKCVFRWEMLMN